MLDAGRFTAPPACHRDSGSYPDRIPTGSDDELTDTKIQHGVYETVSPPALLGVRKIRAKFG